MTSILSLQMDDCEKDYQLLRSQIMGYIVSQTIITLTRVGVIEQLGEGPASAATLAAAGGFDEDALGRMLALLDSEGILAKTVDSTGPTPVTQFMLAPRGRLLLTSTRGSLSHLCRLMDGVAYECWAQAEHSLRTGEPAFNARWKKPFFDWLAGQPTQLRHFHEAQAGLVERRLDPLLSLEWTHIRDVVDVGAGDGELLTTLLAEQPHLRGVAFDLPEVVAARGTTADGAAKPLTWVGGSFFDEVPTGGEVYVLAQILHDWSDADAVRILRNCRAAMTARSSLLVLEQVLPEDSQQHPARLLDLHMLVLLGGRERTLTQWLDLFGAADLRLINVVSGSRSTVLEVVPAAEPASQPTPLHRTHTRLKSV